jgi:hypothetical protein
VVPNAKATKDVPCMGALEGSGHSPIFAHHPKTTKAALSIKLKGGFYKSSIYCPELHTSQPLIKHVISISCQFIPASCQACQPSDHTTSLLKTGLPPKAITGVVDKFINLENISKNPLCFYYSSTY